MLQLREPLELEPLAALLGEPAKVHPDHPGPVQLVYPQPLVKAPRPVKGKHSHELKRLSDSKARIDTVETASVVGENSLVTITFKNCRIKRYSTDGEKEEWTVEFESAKRQTLSIGAPR